MYLDGLDVNDVSIISDEVIEAIIENDANTNDDDDIESTYNL